jgi:DNA-binding NtrC family response regulator
MNNHPEKLLGGAPEFLRALHAARMVAGTDATVLVSGEPGTGKELLAREIHATSRRSGKPFTVITCSGLGEDELDAQLNSSADGSTLFLAEVGDLTPGAQAKLIHFLDAMDSGKGERGSVRIIASTSRDLLKMQEAGEFRDDLFFRLHIVPIEIPALRERTDDIVLLLKQFTSDLSRRHGRKAPRYSVTSRNLLKSYRWPGNVRELHNFCERMVILMAGCIVQPENMPVEMRRQPEAQMGGAVFVLPEGGIDLAALESDVIRQAINMAGGNRSKAARLLGLSRDTLLYRMQKHAIQV